MIKSISQKLKVLFLLTLLCLSGFWTQAQFTSAGTEFYFAYLQNRVDQNGAPTNCLIDEVKLAFYIANNTNLEAQIEIDFTGSNVDYIIDGLPIISGSTSNSHQFILPAQASIQIKAIPTISTTFNDPCDGNNPTSILDMRQLTAMNNGQSQHKAFVIKSINETKITAYAESYMGGGRDASLILPINALGYQYFACSVAPNPLEYPTVHYGANQGGPAELVILSVHDGSNINFRLPPSVPTTSSAWSNVDGNNTTLSGATTHTINLDKGEIYQIQADSFDLTGTVIWSFYNSFAVFSGSMAGKIISDSLISIHGSDYIYEQMFPVKNWGSEYIVTPINNDQEDLIKIIALDNGTQVSVNGVLLGTINSGEFLEYSLGVAETAFISCSSSSINVIQFTKSSYYDIVHQKYDPSMVVIPATNQSIDEITFSVLPEIDFTNPNCSDNTKEDYCNIVALTSETQHLMVDDNTGIPVQVQNYSNQIIPWTIIPGNNSFSYTVLDLSNNSITNSTSYHLFMNNTNSNGFNAIVYGNDCAESYAYAAGINIILDSVANNQLQSSISMDGSYCFGDTVLFTASANTSLDSVIWTFNDTGAGLANTSTSEIAQYSFSSYGYYTVNLLAYANGNSSLSSANLYIYPAPIIDIGPDTIFTTSFPITLNATYPNGTYQWSTGQSTSLINVNSSGTYSVTVTNIYGCFDKDMVEVIKSNGSSSITNSGIQIYPNPASTVIHIESSDNQILRCEISDISGRLIQESTTNQTTIELDVSGITSGIYWIKIVNTEGLFSKAIYINR